MLYVIIYWYVNFWEILGIFLVVLLWKNNYVWLLEWLENYKIVVYVIIYWFVNFWEIVGIFFMILLWENNYIGLLGLLELLGNFGIMAWF